MEERSSSPFQSGRWKFYKARKFICKAYLGQQQDEQILACTCYNLKNLYKDLIGLSHILSHRASITCYSLRAMFLKPDCYCGNSGLRYIAQTGVGIRSLRLPGPNSKVHWQSYLLSDLLQPHLRGTMLETLELVSKCNYNLKRHLQFHNYFYLFVIILFHLF